MRVTLKSVTPNAEVNIVEIARVSSKREDKAVEPEKLINYLIKNKHWSPFQHAYLTVEIITSKAISIQYLRHLSFTFQEFSQRYAVVENIEPIELRKQADKNRQSSTDLIGIVDYDKGVSMTATMLDESIGKDVREVAGSVDGQCVNLVYNAIETSIKAYEQLLNFGVARECARMILPMATQTTLLMTGSVRSWIHLIQLRDDPHAQKEAQEIARAIKEIFKEQFPIISKALGWKK